MKHLIPQNSVIVAISSNGSMKSYSLSNCSEEKDNKAYLFRVKNSYHLIALKLQDRECQAHFQKNDVVHTFFSGVNRNQDYSDTR